LYGNTGNVDPVRDLAIISEELRLKDIQNVTRNITDLANQLKRNQKDKVKQFELVWQMRIQETTFLATHYCLSLASFPLPLSCNSFFYLLILTSVSSRSYFSYHLFNGNYDIRRPCKRCTMVWLQARMFASAIGMAKRYSLVCNSFFASFEFQFHGIQRHVH
jgi:hypothetical protein